MMPKLKNDHLPLINRLGKPKLMKLYLPSLDYLVTLDTYAVCNLKKSNLTLGLLS